MEIKKIRIIESYSPALSDYKIRNGRKNANTYTEITCARLAYAIDRAAYKSIELSGTHGHAFAYVELEDEKGEFYILGADDLDFDIEDNQKFLGIDEAMAAIEDDGNLSLMEIGKNRGMVWDGHNWKNIEPKYSPTYCFDPDMEEFIWGDVFFRGIGDERGIDKFEIANNWIELCSRDYSNTNINGEFLSDIDGDFLLENLKLFKEFVEVWSSDALETTAIFCLKQDIVNIQMLFLCPRCGRSIAECDNHEKIKNHEVSAFLAGA